MHFCIVGYNSLNRAVEPELNFNLQLQACKVFGLSSISKMIGTLKAENNCLNYNCIITPA